MLKSGRESEIRKRNFGREKEERGVKWELGGLMGVGRELMYRSFLGFPMGVDGRLNIPKSRKGSYV